MKLGQLVMLIYKDNFMPPLGSIGIIAGLEDEHGDYCVEFEKYPCPVEDIYWYIPKNWLIPLHPDKKFKEEVPAAERPLSNVC